MFVSTSPVLSPVLSSDARGTTATRGDAIGDATVQDGGRCSNHDYFVVAVSGAPVEVVDVDLVVCRELVL